MPFLSLLHAIPLCWSAAAQPQILQISYDVAAPFTKQWNSQIVQVTREFESWGVSVSPEWIERDYHLESWIHFDTTALVTTNGFGIWASAFVRPFEAPDPHRIKLGAYVRARRFHYSYTSYGLWDDGTDFDQTIASWAVGGEIAMTFHPTAHIVVEPYTKVGLARYYISWKGSAPEYPHPSEFRYKWDPDARLGIFAGWEF